MPSSQIPRTDAAAMGAAVRTPFSTKHIKWNILLPKNSDVTSEKATTVFFKNTVKHNQNPIGMQ